MKTIKSFLFTFVILMTLFLSSCTDTKTTDDNEKNIKNSTDTLTTNNNGIDSLTLYFQEVEKSWLVLKQKDSTFFANSKGVIEEIGYNDKHDASALRKVKKLGEKVEKKVSKYSVKDFPSIKEIDKNDLKISEYLSDLENLMDETPGMADYIRSNELLTEMTEIDKNIVSLRSNFDEAVKKYNKYIENNKDKKPLKYFGMEE